MDGCYQDGRSLRFSHPDGLVKRDAQRCADPISWIPKLGILKSPVGARPDVRIWERHGAGHADRGEAACANPDVILWPSRHVDGEGDTETVLCCRILDDCLDRVGQP